jgi:hypothetical protein
MNTSKGTTTTQVRAGKNIMSPSEKEKSAQYQKALLEESEKLEMLSSQARLMQQQIGNTISIMNYDNIDLYQFEKATALEKLNRDLNAFSKTECDLILKIKKPSPDAFDIVNVFVSILNLNSKTWKSFKVSSFEKNLNIRKSLKILDSYFPKWQTSNLRI